MHTSKDAVRTWAIGIVVQAHNEELLIRRCLESLLEVTHDGPIWIVVVADTCSDQTVAIARSVLGDQGEVVESTRSNAGASRALGAKMVLRQLSQLHPNHRVWLANTDADSCVPTYWIEQQLRLADRGVHAIAGVVDIDSFDDFGDLAVGVKRQFDRSYGIVFIFRMFRLLRPIVFARINFMRLGQVSGSVQLAWRPVGLASPTSHAKVPTSRP